MTINLYLKCVLDGIWMQQQQGNLLPEETIPTMCLALHVSSVVLGLAFWLLGHIRSAVALSYLPYPVVAGFLAMVGACIVKGAVGLLLPLPGQSYVSLILGISLASISSVLKIRFNVPSNLTNVVSIVLSLVVFLSWAYVMQKSTDDLRDEGWLFPGKVTPISALGIWQWDYSKARVLYSLPGADALALAFVACLQRALLITGVESIAGGAPYSVDDEMKSISACVVGCGALGGVAINPAPSLSALVKEGAKGEVKTARFAAAWVTGLELAVWALGLSLNSILPRFLLGGLLMGMGVSMLVDWVWLVRHRIQWTGNLVIYGMLLCSLYFSLIYGVVLGVVLAMFRLNIRLASLDALKYHVSLEHFRSGAIYTEQQRSILRSYGEQVQIIGVTGFFFEGVTISLCKYLKEILRTHEDLHAIIIDCMACQGLNDSAASHIMKVEAACRIQNVCLVMCNLGPEDEKLLQSWEAEAPSNNVLYIESSLREALGFAEHNILEATQLPDAGISCDRSLAKQALDKWLGQSITKDLFTLVESSQKKDGNRIDVEPALVKLHEGTTLSSQGRVPSAVFIAIPGHSVVQAEVQTGTDNRPAVLLSTKLGAICGVEGLIGMPSKGTWRIASDSLFLKLSVSQAKANLAPETFGKLITEGFNQLGQQWDQLSALYTLAQGGGWHGVTYDATTKETTVASEEYQKVSPTRATSATRHRNALVVDGAGSDKVHHDDGDHNVAAILSRKTMVLEKDIQFEERLNDKVSPLNRKSRKITFSQNVRQKDGLEELRVPILQEDQQKPKDSSRIMKRLSTMAFATSTNRASMMMHMSDAA
jgi:SulP family sulfate permease